MPKAAMWSWSMTPTPTQFPSLSAWPTNSLAAGRWERSLPRLAETTAVNYAEFASSTAPYVRILEPTLNQTVSGFATIDLQAADPGGSNRGVVQLGVIVDGQPLASVGFGSPTIGWSTYSLSNGAHTIRAASTNGSSTSGSTASRGNPGEQRTSCGRRGCIFTPIRASEKAANRCLGRWNRTRCSYCIITQRRADVQHFPARLRVSS